MSKNFNDHGQYGELLWEEPAESYDFRIRLGLYSGASLLIIGLILLTIGLEFNIDMFSYTSGLLFVSGFIILILGFGPLPIRIYETGILISNRLFGYRHFIQWTQIGQIHEVRSFTTTNIIFRTEKRGVIAINKNSPGLQETIDNINRNELIGYKIDVYNEENIITQRKLELWVYPISVIGSFLIILAMIFANCFIHVSYPCGVGPVRITEYEIEVLHQFEGEHRDLPDVRLDHEPGILFIHCH
jgi:hypothetical protein